MKPFEVNLNDDFKITRCLKTSWYEIKCRKHSSLVSRTHWRVYDYKPSQHLCVVCKVELSKELVDKAAFIVNYYGEEGA